MSPKAQLIKIWFREYGANPDLFTLAQQITILKDEIKDEKNLVEVLTKVGDICETEISDIKEMESLLDSMMKIYNERKKS